MLQNNHGIEGLEGFVKVDLPDDTPPNATRVWFDVVEVEMPALSEQAGRLITKPFVHKFFEMELGHMAGRKRVKDQVELDEVTGKWKVVRLNPDPKRSDIIQYKDAWNAFARGQSYEAVGTPLSLLLRSDKGKLDKYKFYHITTVEQLASLPDSQVQDLGMGTREDVNRAKEFLARTKDSGASIALSRELEEERTRRKALEEQLAALNEKVMKLMEGGEEEPEIPVRKRGRPKKEVG